MHTPGQTHPGGQGTPWQGGFSPAPHKPAPRRWIVALILAVLAIVLGILLFFLMRDDGTGDDADLRRGVEQFFDDNGLTRTSAIAEGGLTSQQYDDWVTCVVDESRTGISESEKQKLIDGELEIDGIENSTFGRIMMTCMLSVDQS